jgi:hypothetical protein
MIGPIEAAAATAPAPAMPAAAAPLVSRPRPLVRRNPGVPARVIEDSGDASIDWLLRKRGATGRRSLTDGP